MLPPAVLLALLSALPLPGQDPETPPPPPRVRPRELPEERLATSLEFQDLRLRPPSTRRSAPADSSLGKGTDLEDLLVSEKALKEMAKARQAMAANKHDAALSHLKKAVELDPDYSKAWNNLGLLHQALGRVAEAEAALRKAVAVNRGNAVAWRNLGFLLLATGRARQAVAPLTDSVRIASDDVSAAAFLGEALFQAGSYADAALVLERARRLTPDYHPVLYRLGCVYARLERFSESLALLERVRGSSHAGIDSAAVEKLVAQVRVLAAQSPPGEGPGRR